MDIEEAMREMREIEANEVRRKAREAYRNSVADTMLMVGQAAAVSTAFSPDQKTFMEGQLTFQRLLMESMVFRITGKRISEASFSAV